MATTEQPKREQFRNIQDFNVASYYYKIGKDYTSYLASTKDAEEQAASKKDADGNTTTKPPIEKIDVDEEIRTEYVPSNYWFRGNTVLVDFTDDDATAGGKIYLYDKDAGTFRGFESAQAVANYFDISLSEVDSKTLSVPSNILNSPDWQGELLNWKFDIKEDGSSLEEPTGTQGPGSSAGLSSIYGQEKMSAEVEEWTGNLVGSIFTSLRSKGKISDGIFNDTVGKADNLAKYINALLYGGYNIGDIYRDIKAKELRINEKGFDESMSANEWYKTPEGEKSKNNTATSPPADLGDMDSDLFNYSVFKIPGKAFSTIIEPIDINSPQFKEEAEKIQASYFDIMMQNSEATTEQQKALALDNWNRFKDSLNTKYGIRLSDNSRIAWNQLSDFMSGYSDRGIGQSGLLTEAMDRQLADVRRSDEILRELKLSEKEEQQRNYLKASGTPEEIKALRDEDIAKGLPREEWRVTKWGLVPSYDIDSFYSLANLRESYPDMTEEEIQMIRDTMLDESGNYRSGLYQNMYANRYNLGEQKKTYQEQQLYSKKLIDEEKAYAPFTKFNPLSSYLPEYAKPDQGIKDYVADQSSVTQPKPQPIQGEVKYNEQGQVWDAMNKRFVDSARTSVKPTTSTAPAPAPTAPALTAPAPTAPVTPAPTFKTRAEQTAFDRARVAANRLGTQPVTSTTPKSTTVVPTTIKYGVRLDPSVGGYRLYDPDKKTFSGEKGDFGYIAKQAEELNKKKII